MSHGCQALLHHSKAMAERTCKHIQCYKLPGAQPMVGMKMSTLVYDV